MHAAGRRIEIRVSQETGRHRIQNLPFAGRDGYPMTKVLAPTFRDEECWGFLLPFVADAVINRRTTMRLLALACIQLIIARCLDAQVPDTTRTYKMKEVVVTATRSELPADDSPVQVDVLDAATLRATGGSTVADLLERTGTTFIRDQGTEGSLKTLSIRGASADEVLVLMNGVRLNSFQNGLVDLSLVPLGDVERIEVVHGGSSALYGSDAVGGVVNIITRRPGTPFGIRSEVGAGSFGYGKFMLESQTRIGSTGILAGYSTETGHDDFPFALAAPYVQAGISPDRTNADFARRQFYLHGSALTDDRSNLDMSAQIVRAAIGAPGPDTAVSLARQGDEDVNLSLTYNDSHLDGAVFALRNSFHYSLENYEDPSFSYVTYYRNLHAEIAPQLILSPADNQRIIIGGEYAHGLLQSADFTSDVTREQKSIYLSGESHFESQRQFFDRLSLYETVRYDDISDVGFAVTPRIGANLRIARSFDTRLRVSFGQNFRSPTFNDLYYPGFSNPLLKPELSTGFDAGLLASIAHETNHTLGITWFVVDTRDRILLDQNYIPQNVGRVLSRGLELAYDGSLADRSISWSISYAFTDARKRNRDYPGDSTYDKQIPYMPRGIANLRLMASVAPVTIALTYSVTGTHYASADDALALSSYDVMNAVGTIREGIGGWNVLLKGELNNVFDSRYEIFPYYPVPGRNVRFSLGIEH